jgi:hypothetical protein
MCTRGEIQLPPVHDPLVAVVAAGSGAQDRSSLSLPGRTLLSCWPSLADSRRVLAPATASRA